MANSRIQGMAEACTTTGNPSLYCVEPDDIASPTSFTTSNQHQTNFHVNYPKPNGNGQFHHHHQQQQQKSNPGIGPPPVEQEPVHARKPEKPDATTFDIVKATQYGAIERVKELVNLILMKMNFYITNKMSLLLVIMLDFRLRIADTMSITVTLKMSHFFIGRQLIIDWTLSSISL
jgi:hypothetical protein